jgi:hypothetical protein
MTEIEMTRFQRFGREVLRPDQVSSLKQRFGQGGPLSNLEIEKLIHTCEFTLDEIEHLLREGVEGVDYLEWKQGCERTGGG